MTNQPRRRQRRLVRSQAREAYIAAGRDPAAAKALLEEKLVGIDPATILLILQIAMRLWEWWVEWNKDQDPPERRLQGEPADEVYAY